MRTRRYLGFVLVMTMLVAAYLFGAAQPGLAIPNPQENCAFTSIGITVADGTLAIPGMSVTISNGSVARRVIAQFSADANVESAAELRIGYKVDAAASLEDTYGPANLANHQEFDEARTVIAVIPLGPGTHTITPYWRVSGTVGKTAVMDSRCFSVEGRTR